MVQRSADSMERSATKSSSSPIKSLAGQMAQKAQKKQTQDGRRYLAIDKQAADRTNKLRGYKGSVAMRRNRRQYDNRGIGYDYGLDANS